ncbi:DNA polymerase III subunit alpha [uncultured Planococcus sp.]|uniref:DNA polymerase III subunit alpha n=1 Tax=uncultured Planococcus sp. TaxID=337815 RepID=UPI00262A2CE2|nr:DNA polymerase III subunit alpha [uncultured Planococcus sp.]
MSMVYPHISTSADLLKSTVRLDELFPYLKEQGAASAAIVNTKLYGILPFWEACRRAGIHGVIGLSAFIEFEEQQYPVVLYAQSNSGYGNLLKISSALSTRDKEAIPEQWLKAYRNGLICVVPNKPEWLLTDRSPVFRYIRELFGSAAFGSLERPGGISSEHERAFAELCDQAELPIIASHESRYLHQQDAFAYEVASAIGQGLKMNDPERKKPEHTHAYVPSRQEFETWFADQPEWLERTAEMLKSCQVTIPMDRQLLPVFPLPAETDKAIFISELCKSGLEERVPGYSQSYQERLDYEMSVIGTMGFIDYFLIVADFMKYARDRDILTGPGRGSSASSLVAYSLKITDVDPIEHGLLFERFLNPERVTLPDIDIDFADYRRHEVVDYVAKKYGAVRTAQIITFGTLSAKAVARDTARVFGFEADELEAISKMIPNRPGTTLRSALKESPALNNWIIEREERKSWFKTALKLEGLPRHASTHAAGVILSPSPLVDHVPIEKGHEGIYLTQWPMQELEAIGLLKMDFLGLRNLTILEQIRGLVYWDTKKRIDYRSIPLQDAETYKLLALGDTTGVFQLESDGMRRALQQIKPTAFGDIVAVNALFRPGPMEFIPLYARRKHKQEAVKYIHPILEPILSETYGVIVYQEQIMHIAAKMAGFSLGEADLLRRAVSKKKREILDEERAHFTRGAKAKGFTEAEASEVYDLIVRFADYGFPKSHAVAYSLISYQLSYMKAHYPVYFYTGLLTNSSGNAEKTKQLLQEIKEKKIPLLPPSVQRSRHSFSVEDGQIRIGLNAVKGVPGTTVKALMAAREDGPFTSLFNIAERISALHFNRKSFEPLIKAGALDDFGYDRGVLLASLDSAIKHAELVKPNEDPGLFDDMGSTFMKPKYTKAAELPESLKLDFEKEVFGFYLSKHPIEREKEERQKSFVELKLLKTKKDRESVRVLGMVEDIKRIRTKKGDAMAFLTLMDETGPASITLFPVEYAKYNLLLEPHAILEIQGVVENRNQKTAIICKNIET